MKSTHLWFLGMNVAILLGVVHHYAQSYTDESRGGLLTEMASEARDWLPEVERERGEPRVLVVLTSSQSQLHLLRRSVAREHIVASSERAFALRGGAIIASDLAAASAPLNALGWGERSLEIVSARRHRPEGGAAEEESRAAPVRDPAASAAVLRDLVKKDTLTRSEAMLLLEHLE